MPAALLPVVSYLGPATADVLTGSLVVEQIFRDSRPGVALCAGGAAARTTRSRWAACLLYTVLLFAMNTLVDISYSILDPRVELE